MTTRPAPQQAGKRQDEYELTAWIVEFANGEIELWLASDIDGEPSFGETVTPLYRKRSDP